MFRCQGAHRAQDYGAAHGSRRKVGLLNTCRLRTTGDDAGQHNVAGLKTRSIRNIASPVGILIPFSD